MTKIAEKHIWYEDSDDVSLPFDSCILRLDDDHTFYNILQSYISLAQSKHESYLTIATKIPGRLKSYEMQLVVAENKTDFESGDEYVHISFKQKLICNLERFQFVSEFTSHELNRIIKRKETTKKYGL
jgi:hypothetical protein